jgi:GAF domain-containing protein
MTTKSTSDNLSSTSVAAGPDLEDINSIRRRLLSYVLYIAAALGAVLFFLRLPGLIQTQQWLTIIIVSVIYVILLAVTFTPERFFNFRLINFLGLLYVIGAFSLFQTGLSGDGRLYLIAFVICINGLTDWIFGLAGSALAALTMVVISVLSSTDIIKFSLTQGQTAPTGLDWTFAIFVLLMISLVASVLFAILSRSHVRNFKMQEIAVQEAAQTKQLIDKSETDHVKQIQKQNSQVEVAGLIAREIATQSNPNELLSKTVDLIRNNFGFYHVGIFVLDESGEFAVLKAATGEAGRQMLEAGHRLRAGEEGIVGSVVKRGEAYIALDVGADAVHFKNPLLPETRSEMALPLTAGGKTIGVLDVQSKEEAAFTTQDVKVLQIVADQLAVAMERSDLVSKLQQTVNELRSGYQTFTQTAWQSFLKKGGKVHSLQITGGKEDVNIPEPVEVADARLKGKTLVKPVQTEPGNEKTMVMLPIKLRDQTLGLIRLQFDSQVIPTNVMEFLQTASDRLALSLENARLLEEIEDRAEQEHLVREISEKITRSPDISEILKTAAAELGKSLGVTNVKVILKPEQKGQQNQ